MCGIVWLRPLPNSRAKRSNAEPKLGDAAESRAIENGSGADDEQWSAPAFGPARHLPKASP